MSHSKSKNPLGAGWHRNHDGNTQNERQRQDYIGVRLGHELRARAIYAAEQLGMPLSTWVRMVVSNALDYGLHGGAMDASNAGFIYGRQLGLALAQTIALDAVRQGMLAMPMTFEEAQARFPDGAGLTTVDTLNGPPR